MAGLVPDPDDDLAGFQRRLALRALHAHLVRIDEPGNAVHHVDAVARQLRFGHVHLGLDHRLHAEGQVRHGDLFLHPVVHAIDGAVVVAGQVQHRLAHGLGGNGAGVDAHAANHLPGLDHSHAFAHLGRGHGGSLPRRPGTDNDEVILYRAHASHLWIRCGFGSSVPHIRQTRNRRSASVYSENAFAGRPHVQNNYRGSSIT